MGAAAALLPATDLLLVASDYPVLALWQMALHGGEAVEVLDAPVWLALKKQPDCRVAPLPLTAGEWALLQGFSLVRRWSICWRPTLRPENISLA